MRVIGITGGVGAGKSAILSYIEQQYKAKVILADNVANDLKEPGHSCYEPIVTLLGKGVLATDGSGFIDRGKMAAAIFSDHKLLEKVNEIIHPAVKTEIIRQIEEARASGEIAYCFVEAALLIEDHYETVVEEMWLIDTEPEIRRSRLKANRGYSDEKVDAIMSKQLDREAYMKHCKVCIHNSTTVEDAYRQVDEAIRGLSNIS